MVIQWNQSYNSSGETIEISGHVVPSKEEFLTYISQDFPDVIEHYQGIKSAQDILNNLTQTGFQNNVLKEELLNQQIRMSDWGEFFAYHQLDIHYQISIPWPSQWDKKKDTHSLPGADIVGLKHDGKTISFVFGEVKTSQESRYPPQVVKKNNDGLVAQIKRFEDKKIIFGLIKWLLLKSKGQKWESDFKSALTYYGQNDTCFSSVGVLIRDTEPTIKDLLCTIGMLNVEFKVSLYAFYIPISLDECIRISNRGGVANVGS
jgi:hypothetical protein